MCGGPTTLNQCPYCASVSAFSKNTIPLLFFVSEEALFLESSLEVDLLTPALELDIRCHPGTRPLLLASLSVLFYLNCLNLIVNQTPNRNINLNF
jgi:hypothetical protein